MEMKLGDSKLSERNQSLHTARLHLNEAEAESRLLVLGAGGGAEWMCVFLFCYVASFWINGNVDITASMNAQVNDYNKTTTLCTLNRQNFFIQILSQYSNFVHEDSPWSLEKGWPVAISLKEHGLRQKTFWTSSSRGRRVPMFLSPIHDWLLIGLVLFMSCACNHSCCKIVCKGCALKTVSLLLWRSFCHVSVRVCKPQKGGINTLFPWWSISLRRVV